MRLVGEGDIELELDGDNNFSSGGIRKDDKYHSGKFTIKDDNAIPGSLTAKSGQYGSNNAIIGSDEKSDASNITITGGTITVYNKSWGAAIGSGGWGNLNNFTITGGTINASSDSWGAAIGSGMSGNVNNLTITGGIVNATGDSWGAAIGSSAYGDVNNLTITGGTITAKGDLGSAIGSGNGGDVNNLIIEGGIIDASCESRGTPIGSSGNGSYSNINITGGEITATCSGSPVAIGGGYEFGWYSNNKSCGSLVISGGNVTVKNSNSYSYATIGVGNEKFYKASQYPEIKDTANVTIMTPKYPVFNADSISTCELHEGGKLVYKNSNGTTTYETKLGAEGSQHQWGDNVNERCILSEAVCTEPAVYYKSCDICGVKSAETFNSGEAPGHLYESITGYISWWCDDEIHCHECQRENCPDRVGSRIDTAEHKFENVDETYYYKMCSTCGYDAYHHINGYSSFSYNLIEAKEATCTEDGNIEYYECSLCRKAFRVIKETGMYEEIDKNEVITTATGHQADSYSSDSVKHWQVCTVCKSEFNLQPHNYFAGETKKETVGGKTYEITEYTCECGRSYEDKKLIDDGSSDDSDDSDDKKVVSKSGSSDSNAPGSWIKDSKGWRFIPKNGSYAKGQTVLDANGNKVENISWLSINSKEYAFGADCYLVTGWVYDALTNKWYYCDENDGRIYGWLLNSQDGYWYYLDKATGEMLSGWQNIDGKDYYFAGTPSAPTYSFDAETDTWVYSNTNGVRPFGSMYANTVTPDNYQVDANGALIK